VSDFESHVASTAAVKGPDTRDSPDGPRRAPKTSTNPGPPSDCGARLTEVVFGSATRNRQKMDFGRSTAVKRLTERIMEQTITA